MPSVVRIERILLDVIALYETIIIDNRFICIFLGMRYFTKNHSISRLFTYVKKHNGVNESMLMLTLVSCRGR